MGRINERKERKFHQSENIIKTPKPKLPEINTDNIGGYSRGTIITYLNGGDIKKVTELIAHRDKYDPYNTDKARYEQKVIYYVSKKNPPYRDCKGNEITEKQYKRSKCAVKGRGKTRYVYIPHGDYHKYGLKNESKKITKSDFVRLYSKARKEYSPSNQISGKCW